MLWGLSVTHSEPETCWECCAGTDALHLILTGNEGWCCGLPYPEMMKHEPNAEKRWTRESRVRECRQKKMCPDTEPCIKPCPQLALGFGYVIFLLSQLALGYLLMFPYAALCSLLHWRWYGKMDNKGVAQCLIGENSSVNVNHCYRDDTERLYLYNI